MDPSKNILQAAGSGAPQPRSHERKRSVSFSGRDAEKISAPRKTSDGEEKEPLIELATQVDAAVKEKTAEKREKLQKVKAVNFGVAINKEAYAQLPPRARSAIKTAFQERQKELDEGAPTLLPRPGDILAGRSITGGHLATDAVLKAMRNEQFLKMVEQVDKQTLKRKFYFYNEGNIETDELFQILQERIAKRAAEHSPSGEQCLVNLLNFSVDWLQKNEGTKLILKAENAVREIVKIAKAYQNPQASPRARFIQEQGVALEKILPRALTERQMASTDLFIPAPLHVDFEKLLDQIAKGEVKKVEAVAKEVAEDLRLMQVGLFCQIKAKDLLQIWETESKMGAAIEAFTNSNNTLFEYVIDSIIFRETVQERQNLMRFFLEVGFQCLEGEDHQSASCLFSVLSNYVFDKLPQTCKEVQEHLHYLTLKKYFNGDREFENIRARLEKCEKKGKPYIPYLPLKLNEFIVKEANHPAIHGTDFNTEKLALLEKLAVSLVAGQGRWLEVRTHPPLSHTDLIQKFKEAPSSSEDEKESFSDLRKFQAKCYQEN